MSISVCDPWRVTETPTIYEWGGGTEAFGRWLNRFYDLVEEEGTLAPLFGGTVTEEHRDHVLAWWCEVMGGLGLGTTLARLERLG